MRASYAGLGDGGSISGGAWDGRLDREGDVGDAAGVWVDAGGGASSSARFSAPSSGTCAAKAAPAIQVVTISAVRTKNRGNPVEWLMTLPSLKKRSSRRRASPRDRARFERPLFSEFKPQFKPPFEPPL